MNGRDKCDGKMNDRDICDGEMNDRDICDGDEWSKYSRRADVVEIYVTER